MPTDPRDAEWSMPGPSVVTFGFDVLDRVEQAVAMVKERLKRAVAAREAVHILFAGETIKPNDPVPAPDLSTTDVHEGYRIVDLDRLLVMKLTAFRLKDRVHLIDMIDVGLIDAATVARMPAVLRPRLEQLLADPNG
jgi:hypothetical protein